MFTCQAISFTFDFSLGPCYAHPAIDLITEYSPMYNRLFSADTKKKSKKQKPD